MTLYEIHRLQEGLHRSVKCDFVCSDEGRSWYSAHRGILWIASTAKTPQSSEVTAVEDFYRKFYSGSYPVISSNLPFTLSQKTEPLSYVIKSSSLS